jgi:hypothetical protein
MESYFFGSVKLLPVVYGITAGISFMVAGIIKGLFAAVSMRSAQGRAESESEG